jgi:DNA-3-methyladenine glycosylase
MRERRGDVRDRDLGNGPGKLCEALGITGALNGLPLRKSAIEILRGDPISDSRVRVTPRVGITKSAEWPLRWLVADNAYVSRAPRQRTRVK